MRARRAAEEAELPGATEEVHRLRGLLPWLLVTAVVVVAVGGYSSYLRNRPPDVPPDCTHAQLVVREGTFESGEVLRFAVTGPADHRYSVGVDVATLGPAPELAVTPAAGAAHGYRSQPVATKRCLGFGRLGLPLPAGEHELTLFELLPSGPTRVMSRPLTVTPPR